ncbi:MAG: hypothetical protein WCI96_13165, partial [Planctomycetota bacterium]
VPRAPSHARRPTRAVPRAYGPLNYGFQRTQPAGQVDAHARCFGGGRVARVSCDARGVAAAMMRLAPRALHESAMNHP